MLGPGNRILLEVASMVVIWWIVLLCQVGCLEKLWMMRVCSIVLLRELWRVR